MNKLNSILGMIFGIVIIIAGFMESYGNFKNLKNPGFYVFIIGVLILLFFLWKYPESPAKFLGATEL